MVTGLAFLVAVGTANAALATAASAPVGGVASAAACQSLLARAPAVPRRPVQLPAEGPLIEEVSEFVELSLPDDQRYVFPTDDERARFQCGFQYAAAGQLVPAARLLQPLQYDVEQLLDTGAGAEKPLVLLVERRSRGRSTGSSASDAPGGSTSSPRRRGRPFWRWRCRIRASRSRAATRSEATGERARWR